MGIKNNFIQKNMLQLDTLSKDPEHGIKLFTDDLTLQLFDQAVMYPHSPEYLLEMVCTITS